MSGDDGNCVARSRVEGKDFPYVLEQNDALLLDMLGKFKTLLDIDHTSFYRVVHNSRCEFRTEYAAGVVINLGHRHFASLHGLSECRAIEIGHRLFLIQTCCRCFLRTMSPTPVRNDETLESPLA